MSAVHDVNVPPRVNVQDIKDIKPKSQDDTAYWEKVKTARRARREALEEEKTIEALEHPAPQESPFQVRGQVDLGTFNLQDEQRRAREDAEQARKDFQEKEKELSGKLEATQKELTESRLTTAMKEMANQFSGLIKTMDQKIDAVAKGADPSNLTTYIESMETLASKMGYQRSDPSAAVGDPKLAIELQKMKLEEAAREREFQLKMKQFEYDMQRQFRKDEQDVVFKKEELEAKKKRDEMFASAPEMVGRAIAHGMMEEGEAPVMREKVSSKGKKYQITAGAGEAGEVDCPGCGQPIVIGPTATKGACAGCGLDVSVTRTKKSKPSEPQPEEPIAELTEEEEEDARRIR